MKNFLKTIGIVTLALVIGFSITACGGGGGGGGGPSTGSTTVTIPSLPSIPSGATAPQLTVSQNASDIPLFTSGGYTAMNATQVNELWTMIEGIITVISIDDLFDLVGFNYQMNNFSIRSMINPVVLARAVQTETIQENLGDYSSALLGNYGTVSGYVRASVSYNDANDDFAARGEIKARLVMNDGFMQFIDEDGEFDGMNVIGTITVDASGSMLDTSTNFSGTATGKVNFAINAAIDGLWVKLIGDFALSNVNLANESATVKLNLKAFGTNNTTPLLSESITITAKDGNITIQ